MRAKVSIAFFSGAGHTARLSELVAEGMSDVDVALVDVSGISDADWDTLDAAHAIVFGSPTYMGSTSAAFDTFLESAAASRWPEPGWTDKIAAGMTIASHPSGDKLIALQRLQTYAAQMGMIWVGQTSVGAPVFKDRAGLNEDGSWIGLMATASRDKSELIRAQDQQTARAFGARIAAATRRWNGI